MNGAPIASQRHFLPEGHLVQPVLHIGYPKTATTWLQKVVLGHHSELALILRKSKGAEWLESVIGDHPFAFDADRLRAAYQACLADSPNRLPFISHEAWAGDPYTGGRNTHQIARRLHAIFPEARIVLVVREPIDMIRSLYVQYIQEGGTLECEGLLGARYPARTYFDRNFLNYDEVADLYVDLFGRDRVCVLDYTMVTEAPQRFLDELLRFCEVSPLDLAEISPERKNRSLSMPSLAIARRLNRILASAFNPAPLLPRRVATWKNLRRFLQRRVDPRLGPSAWNLENRPLISNALTRELELHYQPHNARLARDYGIVFPTTR